MKVNVTFQEAKVFKPQAILLDIDGLPEVLIIASKEDVARMTEEIKDDEDSLSLLEGKNQFSR